MDTGFWYNKDTNPNQPKGPCYHAEKVKVIENEFQTRVFSIDFIIQKVIKKFNFRPLCCQVGF